MFISSSSFWTTSRLRVVPLWLLAACLLSSPAVALDRENRGFGLDRAFAVTGAYGFGKRAGEPGQSFVLRAEGAGLWMTTPLNNRGGIEGGMELGYDGFKDTNRDAALSGFLWDFWMGFPITLVEKEEGHEMLFTSSLAPGMGLSGQHAYVYIKGKIAAKIVPKVAMELNYQWTPYTGSVIWGTDTGPHSGFAMGFLRYATYYALNEDISLMVYFDWRQSNIDDPRTTTADQALQQFTSEPYSSSAFLPITRTRWDNNYRIGFGVAF